MYVIDLPEYQNQETLINMLPVSYHDFSAMTSLYERAFGVYTSGNESADLDGFLLNKCIRRALLSLLVNITTELEQTVGFNISERYHSDRILIYPKRNSRTILSWPGVETLNVQRTYSYLDNVTFDFYLEHETALVYGGNTYFVADVDNFSNPDDIIVRRHTDNEIIPRSTSVNITQSGGNWLYPLNTNIRPLELSDNVDGYHKKYAIVDYTVVGTEQLEDVIPFYPGTEIEVPYHKREDLGGGVYRFWVYVYALVKPEFEETGVNLLNYEYWKLYNNLDFGTYSETSVTPTLEIIIQNENGIITETSTAVYSIIDASRGIIEISLSSIDDAVADAQAFCTDGSYISDMYLNISYKTNPQILNEKYKAYIGSLRRALIHKVAALTPLTDCGCMTEISFISEQQKSYDDIYLSSNGIRVYKPNYGQRHGEVVYTDLVNRAIHFKKPISQIT